MHKRAADTDLSEEEKDSKRREKSTLVSHPSPGLPSIPPPPPPPPPLPSLDPIPPPPPEPSPSSTSEAFKSVPFPPPESKNVVQECEARMPNFSHNAAADFVSLWMAKLLFHPLVNHTRSYHALRVDLKPVPYEKEIRSPPLDTRPSPRSVLHAHPWQSEYPVPLPRAPYLSIESGLTRPHQYPRLPYNREAGVELQLELEGWWRMLPLHSLKGQLHVSFSFHDPLWDKYKDLPGFETPEEAHIRLAPTMDYFFPDARPLQIYHEPMVPLVEFTRADSHSPWRLTMRLRVMRSLISSNIDRRRNSQLNPLLAVDYHFRPDPVSLLHVHIHDPQTPNSRQAVSALAVSNCLNFHTRGQGIFQVYTSK